MGGIIMQYKDLNLKKIREENGLDFAHFTYNKGMCSCCYGPLDLPGRYWRGGKKPVEVDIDGTSYCELDGEKVKNNDIQFILFKNANNGSGYVKGSNEIKDYQCIEWDFPMEKMKKICQDLQEQVGQEYVVMVPPNNMNCIIIFKNNNKDSIKRHIEDGYKYIWEV
jgi:hypothetical protein